MNLNNSVSIYNIKLLTTNVARKIPKAASPRQERFYTKIKSEAELDWPGAKWRSFKINGEN